MSLKNVRQKLENSEYSNPSAFFSDLNLIWSNCKTYNQEDSEIYKQAQRLEMLTTQLQKDFNDNRQKKQAQKQKDRKIQREKL